MATGLSNKVVAPAGDNQRSNDYLRLKRVNHTVMNSLMNASTTGNDSTGP